MIDEIVIKYVIGDIKKIKLFGGEFIKNNINNCKMKINNKEEKLREFYIIETNEEKNYHKKEEEQTKSLKSNTFEEEKNNNQRNEDISKMMLKIENKENISDKVEDNSKKIEKKIDKKNEIKKQIELHLIGINKVTNISFMFSGCKSLLSLSDISQWNTSTVTNMSNMFYGCKSLTSLPDISHWDTSNVTDIVGCSLIANHYYHYLKYLNGIYLM